MANNNLNWIANFDRNAKGKRCYFSDCTMEGFMGWFGPKKEVQGRKFPATKAYPFENDKVAQARSRRSDVVDYIMDTFPIVKRKDEEKHGEYRTKRVILDIYDEMTEAMRTGIPYKTRLDPPPGPPADEHGNFLLVPEWKPGQPKPSDWPLHIHPPRGVI
jgi:hypothetical protein